MRRHLGLTLLVLAFPFSPTGQAVAAQGAGDLIVLDTAGKTVLVLPRGGGAPTTLQALRPDLVYGPMMAGPGDHTAWLIATRIGGINRHYLQRVSVSGTTTLSTFMIIPELTVDMGLDDAGDLLLLTRYNHARNGLYVAPRGSSTLQLVARWPAGAAEAVAFTEDLDTGDWMVLDEGGYVHRLARAGGAVLSLARVSTTTITSGDLVMDPRTGHPLIVARFNVLSLDPTRRRLTTFYRIPVTQGGTEGMGLSFDHRSRGFLVSGWTTAGPRVLGLVVQLDARGRPVRTHRVVTGARFENVFAAWGRAFTPLTAPALGRTYRLRLRSRADAGLAYVAALSFGTRPGLPAPLGPIPLNPDPLLFLSLSGAPLFRGFSGTLDAAGGAVLEVDLPGERSLRGLRVAVAAVALDGGGIRRILGPLAFSLR